MEPDDDVERRHVRVTECDEVGVLGEPVDHAQDDTLAMNTRETLDEVECDVRANLRWHLEGLERTGQMEGLCLVALACQAGAHKLSDKPPIMLNDEILAEALKSFLHTFMASGVDELEDRGQGCGHSRHEHVGAAEDKAIHEAPRRAPISNHGVTEGMKVIMVL
jgi:hypothetical protein